MVGQLEFFYDQAPDVMRSMGMAMQMLSISLGSYLSGTLTAIIRTATSVPGSPGGWLPKVPYICLDPHELTASCSAADNTSCTHVYTDIN